MSRSMLADSANVNGTIVTSTFFLGRLTVTLDMNMPVKLKVEELRLNRGKYDSYRNLKALLMFVFVLVAQIIENSLNK